jgi:TonB family protein
MWRKVFENSLLKVSVLKVAPKIQGFVCLVASIALPLAMFQRCAAQTASNEDSAPHVVLSKLSPPVYPPLARQARIAGDVTLTLSVHADGSTESITTINGHPMLVQAALDSARQSQFQCRDCGASNASETLTYSFRMSQPAPDPCCCSSAASEKTVPPLQVTESGDHIVLTATPGCICPDRCTSAWVSEHARYRSVKCFFLWKCGFHDYSIY